jgi:hypothetical protein
MAFTHSVSATANANRNTDDPTIAITTVSGDTLLVLGIYLDDDSEGTVTSISDTQTNTWVQAHTLDGGSQRGYIYYVDGPAIGATTITVTTSAACDTVLAAVSFQGATRVAGVLGDVGDGTRAGFTNVLTGTGGNTLSVVGESGVVVAMAGGDTNRTLNTGFHGTGQVEVSEANNGGAEKFCGGMTYELVNASGTNEQDIAWDGSATFLIVAAEFRAEPPAALPFQVI